MKRVVGITGGVGSGKSRILSILKEQYRARILQADQIAAELEEPGREGLRLLTEHFGRQILDEKGALDRSAFSDLIFRNREALTAVNEIIHPLTFRELRKRIETDGASLVAVEAALFTKENCGICQEIWFVDTTEANRIARLMESRGYTREKCLDIMNSQPSREDFLRFADRVIDNNGTTKEAEEQIARLLAVPGYPKTKENGLQG